MKKGLILYSLGVIAIMSFLSFSYNSTTSKCVRIKCGNKAMYKLVSGVDEIEIGNYLKTNYPECTFEYVSKKKCKKQ
jgi:hypothetical protein